MTITDMPDVSSSLVQELQHRAERAIKHVLPYILKNRPDARHSVTIKPDHAHAVVTELDRQAELMIRDFLLEKRPEDSFLGEEHGEVLGTRKAKENVRWVVDPIDGSTNMIRVGEPFAISIAGEVDGCPVAGAIMVIEEEDQRLYVGGNGQGAYRNGSRIHVSGLEAVDEALIAYDGNQDDHTTRHHMEILGRLEKVVRNHRKTGTTATDYCRVAEGRYDGTFQHGNGWWDIAAGIPIVRAAGGIVSSSQGGEPTALDNMACTPAIAPTLQRIIGKNPYTPFVR